MTFGLGDMTRRPRRHAPDRPSTDVTRRLTQHLRRLDDHRNRIDFLEQSVDDIGTEIGDIGNRLAAIERRLVELQVAAMRHDRADVAAVTVAGETNSR